MKTYINIKRISPIILFVLVILLFLIFIPIINNQKKELPDGTLMSRNRFNGQISIKLPNNEFTHFQTNNPFYKEILDVFNNY